MPGANAGLVRALVERGVERAGGRWGDLRLRVISAAVLAPVVLYCIWVGGGPWVALVVVAALAMGMEWVEMMGLRSWGWPGMLVPLGTALVGLAAAGGAPGWTVLGLLAVMAGAAWWFAGRWAAGGIAYIGVAVVALCWLRLGGTGRAFVLFLMFSVWASDIGAYVVGRVVGGAKLAPSISPGKTRSGAVGGLVVAAVVGMGLTVMAGGPEIWLVGVVAGILAVASQVGDLFESWVKRRSGVKDSGWLIPGHGGVLDRLDGVLAAAPVGVALVKILGLEGVS